MSSGAAHSLICRSATMCEVAVKKAIIGFIPLAMTTWHSLVLGACFQITEASTESHPVSQSTSAVSNDKFVDLYNGKDLTGWQTKGNWIPQPDGSLLIEPRENETGWSRFDAYLWTTRKYKDFELRVEYAYPQNGNSGVYFRVADRHNPVATGIEAQIFDSSKHKGATTDHSNGGIIPAGIAPSQNMARPPGEWNRMIVRCAGDRLTVRLNGTEVVNVRLSKTALKDRQREGYIGLQDHGRPHTIRFRNIQIKEIAPSAPDAAQTFFDRKILPVFREKCIHCHGEDEQEGSLRLDSLVHVMRGGNSGEPVLVVGQDEESHLIHLVTTANKQHRMPLDDDPLSTADIQLLREWISIERGWDTAIAEAATIKSDHWSFQPIRRPEVPQSGHSNPIDSFVAQKLSAKDMQLSAEANQRRLLRRLFLVTHGVPASPEQTQEFLASKDADKWQRVVDKVLGHSRYGERFAVNWLDLIRFSETDGFEINAERLGAWRFRDWVIKAFNDDMPYDQFAIRQLAGDVVGDQVGTGFLVAGPHNAVVEKNKKGQAENVQNEVSDFLNATGTTFLGLTLGCARCHNHKFDPISQKDFYSVQAVFSGVNHGLRSIPQTATQEKQLREAETEIAATLKSLSKYTKDQSDLREPVDFKRNVESFPATTARFARMTINGTTAAQPCIDELQIFAGDKNVALNSAGARTTSGGDFVHPLHKLAHINDGRFGNSFSWIARDVKGWVQIELAEATSINQIVWGRDRTGRIADRLATDYRIEISKDGESWATVGDSTRRRKRGATVVYQFDRLQSPEKEKAEQQHAKLTSLLLRKTEIAKPATAYLGTFSPPAVTHRLYRGDPMSPREEMTPNTLAVLGKLNLSNSTSGPDRRLAFAKWVASADNPLAARVMVNRIWQFHFGEGLVSTPSDFGANGAPPSHPELLDWLAAEFIASGWSNKHIHRLILTSKTWRQDSRPRPEALAQDSSTQLLWRFPPRRLEAEAIRDSILAASGKLQNAAGGPGFSAFRVGTENVRHYFPKTNYGPDDWRRMVYMTRVRREVESVFGLFDCPDGNQVAPKRTRSTTPLQALNLFNSKFVLQQAEFLAQRLEAESETPVEMIETSYRLCFGRSPTHREMKLGTEMLEQLGVVQYCRVLLNSNEFVFVL
jgi:hypothetical protein